MSIKETVRELIDSEKEIAKKRADLKQNLEFYIVTRRKTLMDMNSAYDNAEMEEYCELKKTAEEYEVKIEEYRAALGDIVSHPDELRRVWSDRSGGYSKSFNTAYNAYKEARKALANQFIKLVEMQNEILAERAEIVKLLPEDLSLKLTKPKLMDSPIGERCARYNSYRTTTDIAFFADCGAMDTDMIPGATQVIMLQEPCSEDYLHHGYHSREIMMP